MKRRVKVVIEYDGTHYHGWQRQQNLPTIQKSLEDVLFQISGAKITVIGSGRTDAGAHAVGQVAHFDIHFSGGDQKLRKALNRLLPADIHLHRLETTPFTFHAQHDAVSKIYQYRIWNSPAPSILQLRHYWWIPTPLNLAEMEMAATYLIGKHDFRTFQNVGTSVISSERTIKRISFEQQIHQIHWEVEADGFLKQMVRNIIGLLVTVGKGRIPPTKVKEILESRDRKSAPPPAPPHGLVLKKVIYRQNSTADFEGVPHHSDLDNTEGNQYVPRLD